MDATHPTPADEQTPAPGAPAGSLGALLGGTPARPRLFDVLLGAGLWLFTLAVAASGALFAGLTSLWLGTVMCAALGWRRSAPVQSAVVVFAAAGLQLLVPGSALNPADLAVLLSVYSLTAFGPERLRAAGLVVGLAGSVLAVLRYYAVDGLLSTSTTTTSDGGTVLEGQPLGSALGDLFFLAFFLGLTVLVAWGAGLLRGARRARSEALAERARLVEVERVQQVRLAAQTERTRIARDLHDVVAHSLAVMITQADGGRYAARTNPQAAVDSLETIADTGRRALSEMRRLLGVLRDETPADLAVTAPQPGLEDLAELVDRVRSGGTAVSLEAQGQARPLPSGMGVAVYRIVQEGLTNVLKHAGQGATARVCLWWSSSALTVDVVDDGRGAGAVVRGDGPGHGLLGMRERAAVYGGVVQAGPMPGGGFGVRAVFPLATEPLPR